jgi:hypothetical protein
MVVYSMDLRSRNIADGKNGSGFQEVAEKA